MAGKDAAGKLTLTLLLIRPDQDIVEGIGQTSCLLAQRPSLGVMLNPEGIP